MNNPITHAVDKGLIDELLIEIRDNTAKLEKCSYHNFVFDGDPRKGKSRCKNCGGTVSKMQRHWYELGIKHDRGAR